MTESWMGVLPPGLRSRVGGLPVPVRDGLEEIRVRENRPLEIGYAGKAAFVDHEGRLTPSPGQAYKPTRDDCARLLDLLTQHSLYSFEEELKRGYITVAGGHRVGLAGRALLEGGRVRLIRDIAGFNLRIARQVRGCAEPVLAGLLDREAGSVHHTLLISPPQHGKTTMLRDLARLISSGAWSAPMPSEGRKVGIVDERSEIAACLRGVPHFDVGPRTDVLDGCPKAEGMMMLIRSMSPDVLIADEIGRPEDASALEEALHAGIRVISTAHGGSLADAAGRPALHRLIRERFFSRYAILRKTGARLDAVLLDGAGNPLRPKEGTALA